MMNDFAPKRLLGKSCAESVKGGVGIAIKNDYSNKVKSYIDTAVINTARNIFIDANSVIDTVNWLVGIGVAGQGAGVVVNVLLNDVHSELEAGIKNSTIEKSGAITINTNKDKKDKIVNRAIAAAAGFQGATPVVSVIKNVYENTVKSYVDNTGSTEIASLSVNANSDRRTENANIGFGAAGEGDGHGIALGGQVDNVLNKIYILDFQHQNLLGADEAAVAQLHNI